MTEFRKNLNTTELRGSGILFAGLFIAQFLIEPKDFNGWAIAICVIVSSYILARGIHKKNRLALVGQGERTSEFWAYVAGSVLIVARMISGEVALALGFILVAVIQAAYSLSRGQAKSYTPTGKATVLSI